MPMVCSWPEQMIWQSFSNSWYMMYSITAIFSLEVAHKSIKMVINLFAMHGCSRDCIYNHSLDCRDLAATTVRTHLTINMKYFISETNCLNPSEMLLLQLNETNSLM